MEYRFISALYNLDTDKSYNKGIQFIEDLRLSNSTERIYEKFAEPVFTKGIGKLEFDVLLNKPYLYAEGTIDQDIDFESNENERLKLLGKYFLISQLACNLLWLIKDNSVNIEVGFLYLVHGNGKSSVTSNMNTTTFFNAVVRQADLQGV